MRIIIVSFVLVLFLGVVVSYQALNSFFGDVYVPEEKRVFVINQGDSVKKISAELESMGIIKSDYWFRTLVWVRGKELSFVAGKFNIPETINSYRLINIFTTVSKKEVKKIRIIEGWRSEDISSYLERLDLFKSDDFLKLVGNPLSSAKPVDFDFLNEILVRYPILKEKPEGKPLEGFLFPDTYEIFVDAKARDVVLKMLDNFSKKIDKDLLEEIERQNKSFYDILIMASIIEAEVPHEKDRALVSGVFWNRLNIGMALQSDATLKYVIGGSRPALTSEELRIDSPYNSYMYRGFPPTPVGNPGLSAIRAAVYPAKTDYLFFLSTPTGETIFSRNLEEHNRAKAKYWR